MILRLDRQVGDFLSWLDGRIGLDKVSLVLTATHGSPPLPEEAAQQGLGAGRIAGQQVVEAINNALAKEFEPPLFVEKYIYPFVYLNSGARSLPTDRYEHAVEVAGRAAQQLEGVAAYYSPASGSVPQTLRDRLRRSWYARRSGDLMIVYEPYFVESFGDGRGTTSGSPYRYDTDVPLILFGAGFRAGRFGGEVDAASLAPTLAALLGVPAPSSATGKVLVEALLPQLPPAPAVGPPTPTR
jgi:hypothetical protein